MFLCLLRWGNSIIVEIVIIIKCNILSNFTVIVVDHEKNTNDLLVIVRDCQVIYKCIISLLYYMVIFSLKYLHLAFATNFLNVHVV